MKASSAKTCPSCGERYDLDVLFCPRDGTPLASSRTPSLQPNDRDSYLDMELGGQIRLKHLIGIGSMGRVYKAWQGGIERDVAVKVLHRELSGNGELVARFHREAKVASRLVHPNVVQVLMTGAVPFSADPHIGGELYLVMEYLDGISLLSALAAAGTGGEGEALALPRALHVALQICDAVGEAHAQGIVHRDLKPENVMLVRRGDDHDYVKVLDFGIARLDWIDKPATQAGLIFGTAKYISPEGAEGLPVGPPADVYSIATMLYQCLAGRTPFEGDSPVALLVQHSHAPAPELRSIARSSYVPEPLAAVVMKNLAKKAADRCPNARALGRELVAAARASGLFPEEIASQSGVFSPTNLGPVKLVSKERTKALDLSPELASRINAAAKAGDTNGSRTPPAPQAGKSASIPTVIDAPSFAAVTPSPRVRVKDVGPTGTLLGEDEDPDARPSSPSSPPVHAEARSNASERPSARSRSHRPSAPTSVRPSPARARSSRPPRMRSASAPPPSHPTPPSADESHAPELDFADDREADTAPPSPTGTTMQGTETSLEADAAAVLPRRKLTRIVAIALCVLVALPLAIFGGRALVGRGSAAESVDATLDEARDCIGHHAWDAPPQHNVKELTDAALSKHPNDARTLELRREAADRIVSDVLARKYAQDMAGALHLAKLAIELAPDNTIAQNLVRELQGDKAPDVAPAGSASADRGAKSTSPRKPLSPVSSGKDPKAVAPGAPSVSGAVLPPPPQPPPPPSDTPTATPAPSSSGPWL